MQESIELLGLSILNKSFSEIVCEIDDCIKKKCKKIYFPVNVDMVVKSQHDGEFRSVLKANPSLLFDGMPLIWAANFLGNSVGEIISGSDLFPALCKFAAANKYKVFFLGAEPGVAIKAAGLLRTIYPSLTVAGVYSPPYGLESTQGECQKIVDMINKSTADILFIGLGAPKQEKWIWKHKDLIHAPVSVCIGAGFDFMAGKLKRAPKWMRRAGLEWFWRLMLEPRRLWKRYLIDDMKFFQLVLKEKLKK